MRPSSAAFSFAASSGNSLQPFSPQSLNRAPSPLVLFEGRRCRRRMRGVEQPAGMKFLIARVQHPLIRPSATFSPTKSGGRRGSIGGRCRQLTASEVQDNFSHQPLNRAHCELPSAPPFLPPATPTPTGKTASMVAAVRAAVGPSTSPRCTAISACTILNQRKRSPGTKGNCNGAHGQDTEQGRDF
jgi:hypothetical protein